MSASSIPLNAEIVTTGTEILLGEIVDTNAVWIAQQLRESGVNLYYKTTVGDNESRLRAVLELGMTRSDVIIVTGGLGPTVDDITRQAIAGATGRRLLLHEGAVHTLRERFARFGSRMSENNLQQALIPEDAILIENPVGTAPGFIVETPRCSVIALPGVPREMKHLMELTVLPYLRQRSGDVGVIRRRVLRTLGIGESTLDVELGELMHGANPTVGLSAHLGQVDVRVTARADTPAAAEELLDAAEGEIRRRISGTVYSTTPEEPFVDVVAHLLHAHGNSVAIFESNSGGALAALLTAAGGEVRTVAAAWTVETAPAELTAGLSLTPPLAEAPAAELARRARVAGGADYAVAILGTSGEDEGVYGRRPGETWIALDGPDGLRSVRIPYGGRDEITVVRVGNAALLLLWHALGGGA